MGTFGMISALILTPFLPSAAQTLRSAPLARVFAAVSHPPRRGGPVCPHGHDFLAGPAYGPTHRSAPTESLAAAIDPGKPGRAEHRPCRPAPVPPVGGGLRPAPPGMAAFCTDPVGSGMFPFLRRGGPVCPPGHVPLPGPAHGPTHRSAPTGLIAASIDPGKPGVDRAPPLPSDRGAQQYLWHDLRRVGEAPDAEIPTLFNSFILNLQIV